ncbi:S8 family peptidase [Treponema vincentii]|uniref:S8 family peptidase n=1 Tax=Treponema vincentii TaxID=69710 RepID=UPI0020A3AFB3|nr:S8 family peptidase [Treponema vincentii]UTC49342.1 S8 family peptidase [Treponema vincentii]
MNSLLQLKGHFEQRSNPNRPGPRNLPAGQEINVSHVSDLKMQLSELAAFWADKTLFKKALVSVHYTDVVAKSNRIKDLLSESPKGANESIVGARFDETGEGIKHVITHCVFRDTIKKAVAELDECIKVLNTHFSGKLSVSQIDDINLNRVSINEMSKTKFVSLMVDCFHVEFINIDTDKDPIEERSIVTLYETDVRSSQILRQIGISETKYQQLDDITFVMNPDQFEILKDAAPYLIAMSVSDIAQISTVNTNDIDEDPDFSIPKPTNEPVVGVIDTHFYDKVYFRNWVQYHNEQSGEIELKPNDYDHGTMVTSIIVDGPTLNPRLEDNCGRFQVRHFGVAKDGRNNSSSIMRAIKRIVSENKDIKVWNLSLGSELEINKNFISPEAAVLDKIQFENDVVFIVSGTNKRDDDISNKRLGAPADSINSIVVNSVDFEQTPALYSRTGPVLSFFNKPDVSYYGGTDDDRIVVYASYGKKASYGTSFAAPWITRKMAFLIYKMGLTKEVAKALLIDSAAGWKKNTYNSEIIGYGVVPKKIDNIIQCENDEIRFVISEVSELFDTYNYNIPIPVYQESQPFIAKATLCYFPKCSRNQGVDYTDTELDLHFGRIKGKGIKSIDNNLQNDEGKYFLKEGRARKLYRKWDNIKLIGEELKDSPRSRKVYDDGRWGISLKTKERLLGNAGKGLNFGLVITLKEINGQNRIEEFIRLCTLRGWLVNKVSVENQIEVYNKADVDIEFEG